MKKILSIALVFLVAMFFIVPSGFTQDGMEQLKAENQKLKQVIRDLERKLQSMDQSGYGQGGSEEASYSTGNEGSYSEGYTGEAGEVSQDMPPKSIVDRPWEKKADINQDGVVDQTEMGQWKDRSQGRGNPPGPQGGPGAGPRFEGQGNPPGPAGGPGKGPRPEGINPPGPKGGPGAGQKFEGRSNPPGPKGGPGKGPRFEGKGNPPEPKGGPGRGNPPGLKGGKKR
ncbi:MAG: hypothetical protein ABIG92_05175 [Candidatus Omnitrophota bacterium]